jgi:uncharacterized damage-inducible protein DinB
MAERLTADQAKLIVLQASLPPLTVEHPISKSVIAAIPPERADYRPDAIVRTAFELAWHIASAEIRFLEAAATGAFDFSWTTPPAGVRTPADINAWYTDRFGPVVERLKNTSGDDLLRTVDFRGLFKFPAYAYIQLGMHHSIHHRGQLSTYLRPMGAKVPSIYGESYDAREARERAASGTTR